MGLWRLIGEIALFRAIFGSSEDKSRQADDYLHHHLGCDHEDYPDIHAGRIDCGPDRYDPLDDDFDDDLDDF